MANPDLTAARDAIVTAYADLCAGKIQEYELNGRRIRYKDSGKLLDEIERLNALINEAAVLASGGTRNYATFAGRPV